MTATPYKLYSYWRSSASYRVRIALELKGLAYEIRPVHLVKDGGEQLRDDYRKKNPMAEVPTLEVPDGDGVAWLAQSVAILEYLEEVHPEVRLMPKDALGRARVRQLVELVNSGIHPLQNLKVNKHLSATFGTDQAANEAWMKHWIGRGFDALEVLVAGHGGPFAYGERPTLADCAAVPQMYNARRYGLDLSAWPALARVWETANALPAFARAAPEAQPDAPEAAASPA